jgi:hypothetical protein
MPEPIAAPEVFIVAPPALSTITAGVPAAAPIAAPPVAPAATPAPAAPATPAVPAPAEPDKEPHWLPDRLRRAEEAARKAILKDLGVENPKDAKLALDAYKADQEAKKSELQKAQERAAALEAKANERDQYRSAVEAQAAADLASLTPEQRAAVEALAGDDPLKVSTAIRALRPTWAVSQTATPSAPVAPAAPPPMAAPVNTAAPAAAPRPTSPKSKWDEFQELERTNPRASGLFYSLNKLAIEASRPAQ